MDTVAFCLMETESEKKYPFIARFQKEKRNTSHDFTSNHMKEDKYSFTCYEL